MTRKSLFGAALAASLASGWLTSGAQAQSYDERPAALKPVTEGMNYERRSIDIPMRDGVKLHTVILIPKGAKDAPILLTRTPYNAEGLAMNSKSGDLATALADTTTLMTSSPMAAISASSRMCAANTAPAALM